MEASIQSSAGSGGGTEFYLPDDVLSVLPIDPYEQLDIARKITSMAIASRVSMLELENDRLRQSVGEKDRLIGELQEKLVELDRMFQQAEARVRTVIEDNVVIAKERDSLVEINKKLARDLAKLETFKKQLRQSLSEDQPSPSSTSTSSYLQKREDAVEIRTYGQSFPQGSLEVTSVAEQKFTTTHIPRRLTPTATPKITSSGNSPKRFTTTISPKFSSGATSPTKGSYDGLTTMSPWFPSSKQSSAANSPPQGSNLPGRTPRVDGKEFFRQARSRLSYEQFGAFLANIKELNAHKRSREETLKKAEEIFGSDNRDLYLSFQGLLMRNMS